MTIQNEGGAVGWLGAGEPDFGHFRCRLERGRGVDGMPMDRDARIRELEAALDRQTGMVRDIDHRVKNNLQLISSFMLLQSRRTENDAARQALKTMLERVNAVTAVHRRLFQGDGAQPFEAAGLVRDLTGDLALTAGRDDVRITLDLLPVALAGSAAALFALILNELLGNALKHAFPTPRAGRIEVMLAKADGSCSLTVCDDGVGMGDAKSAFGLTIAGLLCQQLRASLDIGPNAPGVRAVMRMPAAA